MEKKNKKTKMNEKELLFRIKTEKIKPSENLNNYTRHKNYNYLAFLFCKQKILLGLVDTRQCDAAANFSEFHSEN